MARKFLVDIDLNKNEIQNSVVQNLPSDPSNPQKGQQYFNTTTNKFRVYNGEEWSEMGSGGGTVTSVAVQNETQGGLDITGSPITNTGTIKIGHTNKVNAKTVQGLYPIKYDENGHITSSGDALTKLTDFTNDLSYVTPYNATNNKIVTNNDLNNAIAGISGGMTFKGTIGTSGTAGTTLPTANVKVGDTYRISSKGSFGGQNAQIGDLFIAMSTTPDWAYVPSGNDEAITSITAGTGLTGGTITAAGTIALAESGVSAGTYQGITVDKYGRITSASNQNYSTLKKYVGNITGDGTKTSFSLTHNLNTKDIIVQVYDMTANDTIVVDTIRTNVNMVTIQFNLAPLSSETYKVVIIG